MSKKDYEVIASVFASIVNGARTSSNKKWAELQLLEIKDTANLIADRLKQDNPNFNKSTFMLACGLGLVVNEQ